MTAFTVRLRDEKYNRLKELAHGPKISVNRLIDELATLVLAEQDLGGSIPFASIAGEGKRGTWSGSAGKSSRTDLIGTIAQPGGATFLMCRVLDRPEVDA
ncbi:MAG: hypothetical protein ACYDBP_13000 [Leptospirales bacterium]